MDSNKNVQNSAESSATLVFLTHNLITHLLLKAVQTNKALDYFCDRVSLIDLKCDF